MGKTSMLRRPESGGLLTTAAALTPGNEETFFKHLLEEGCALLRLSVFSSRQSNFNAQQILWVEAGINLLQPPETLNH